MDDAIDMCYDVAVFLSCPVHCVSWLSSKSEKGCRVEVVGWNLEDGRCRTERFICLPADFSDAPCTRCNLSLAVRGERDAQRRSCD